MVTDISANVTQQILYAPFGEVLSEYNAYWHQGKIPDYLFNAKELDEENGMYYYSARYYAPPVFTSRDPLFEEKPWMSPYAYCSNNPVSRIDPDGLFDTENIESGKNYKVIAVFKSDYKDDKALTKDVKAAQKAGMPIMFVDDINDFADAMKKGLEDKGSSTESYTLNSHGMNGNFDIGSTEITKSTDFSVLSEGLKDKTVFIGACNVASGNDGKKLIQNFSKKTSSTVIAASKELIGGYNYKGGFGLNWHGNVFHKSTNGSAATDIYNVRIDKNKGIKYETSLPSISIFGKK
jgi:RHS repeat-associated protein